MSEARIGRLLAASLHQAIADELPTRLDFYEYWLSSDRLHGARVGLSAFGAVLSFLRREGPAYDVVTARAGRYAAAWALTAMPELKRWAVRGLPRPLRTRATLWVARSIAQAGYAGTDAAIRQRRGEADFEIRGSLFCDVREESAHALCGFYAAMLEHLLQAFDLAADARVSSCRAAGDDRCRVAVTMSGAPAAVSGDRERAA